MAGIHLVNAVTCAVVGITASRFALGRLQAHLSGSEEKTSGAVQKRELPSSPSAKTYFTGQNTPPTDPSKITSVFNGKL